MASPSDKMKAAYDNALLGILQNEGNLEQFLDVIFGFLCRRTDFFRTMQDPKQKYGFPPGVAEKIILTYFKKYKTFVEQIEAEQEAKKVEKESVEINEIEVESDDQTSTETKEMLMPNKEDDKPTKQEQKVEEKPKQSPVNPSAPNDQSVFQSNPDSYNGAIRDRYNWSQNYDDVDVKIQVEKSVAKAKQVKVDIQRKHLKVFVKETESSNFETIIDGELQHEVNKEESMWSLESRKNIQITLTKCKNIWWTMLVHG
uniref:CS domain-containing protein n=1 Tax=Ciona savignyi TaxID=51511 RepID=H2Y4A2_CIOSA